MARVDVDTVAAPSFGLADQLRPFRSEWHQHRRHQLLYAASGAMRLEAADGQWLLPPQRAAWIPRRLRHRVSASGPIALRTLYLAPSLTISDQCRVFELPAVGRELILHAMRWGPTSAPRDPLARSFFHLLA